MKSLKIASMLIMAVFSLSMASTAFAADNYVAPIKEEKNLTVKVNEIVGVKLESNPTTGYNWFSEFDSKSLKLVNETYVPDMPILCGSGGHKIITFKALKPGETDITMNYIQPWDNFIPAKVAIYHVKIIK